MAMSGIDESQRKAARVAGFAYLITFATVVYVNFGIGIFDIALSFWLLFKGLRPSGIGELGKTSG